MLETDMPFHKAKFMSKFCVLSNGIFVRDFVAGAEVGFFNHSSWNPKKKGPKSKLNAHRSEKNSVYVKSFIKVY